MRKKFCLNGEWDFMPDFEGKSPREAVESCHWTNRKVAVPSGWKTVVCQNSEYQPYNVFEYPTEWNDADSGVLGRTFRAGKREGKRIFLKFNGILQSSEVFVNGVSTVRSNEGFLPIETDITGLVREDGENELKVWCGSFDAVDTDTGHKLLAPCGSWFGTHSRGIWQDVFLEYVNPLSIKNIHVVTSVRRQEVCVKACVRNAGGNSRAKVWFRIFDGDAVVKEHSTDVRHFEAGADAYVEFREKWEAPTLWSPENPHLYRIQVEISENGRIADAYETRFGFREFWIEGPRFYLNGVRVNLRTDSWHYQGFVQQNREYALNWYKACRDMGCNAVRLHAMPYPELYLDAADEFGMLIIDESAIYGSGKAMQADHPLFIENCRKHLTAFVLRDRNHPCVINWSMQNEMRWVEGRDGYKAAMKGLVNAMKALDCTRPISFDGDNRLVDPGDMEIVSMHYNIDGMVKDWDRTRPLAFGEHGSFHYISPQVAAAFGGPEVYTGFDKCVEAIGAEERHFNEYARKEEVTAVSPFNMANYMMRSMPGEDVRLYWEDMTAPGAKPAVVKKHSLTINNGYLKNEPVYLPNPAFDAVRQSLKKAAVIADQYNTSFFGGTKISRSFSIYNDTESAADVKLSYGLSVNGKELVSGTDRFMHKPGERIPWKIELPFPEVDERTTAILTLVLNHEDKTADTLENTYSIYPGGRKHQAIKNNGKKIAYVGNKKSYEVLSGLLESVDYIHNPGEESLKRTDLLIIGDNYQGKAEEIQALLDAFVSRGGFVIILEQKGFAPGDMMLSGKKFFASYIADKKSSVLKGLKNEDLSFWGEENINTGDSGYLVQNAFGKPVNGDVKILLECGEGNFGWGGLLWTSLVEYSIGKGKMLLCQIGIMDNLHKVPQAMVLLRNMLEYGMGHFPARKDTAGIITARGSQGEQFIKGIGLDYTLAEAGSMSGFASIILDPDSLESANIEAFRDYIAAGGKLFILPAGTGHADALGSLLGAEVDISEAEAFQLGAKAHELTCGISAFDLYHYENVTYSPENKVNEALCTHSIRVEGGKPLFETVKNPWQDYFIKKLDAEPIKVAIADMNEKADFSPLCYGAVKNMGKGMAVLCQIRLCCGNEKIKRVYSRLFSNANISSSVSMLKYVKEKNDYAIQCFMVLPWQKHYDYNKAEAYFAAPDYVLNNLGEGVYGWMQRVEKKNGYASIPGSAGKTYFMTVFIASDINRDPEKRAVSELPDSSIVPDVFVDCNCRIKLVVNGRTYFESTDVMGDLSDQKVEDVVLGKGVNRMLLVCKGGEEDIRVNINFKNKYGDYVEGLRYLCTLD